MCADRGRCFHGTSGDGAGAEAEGLVETGVQEGALLDKVLQVEGLLGHSRGDLCPDLF